MKEIIGGVAFRTLPVKPRRDYAQLIQTERNDGVVCLEAYRPVENFFRCNTLAAAYDPGDSSIARCGFLRRYLPTRTRYSSPPQPDRWKAAIYHIEKH